MSSAVYKPFLGLAFFGFKHDYTQEVATVYALVYVVLVA